MKYEMKTKDFYTAVILKTLGYPLLRLEHGNARFITFVFQDNDNTSETAIQAYWDRKTKVIARDLIDTINELKTRIYEKS